MSYLNDPVINKERISALSDSIQVAMLERIDLVKLLQLADFTKIKEKLLDDGFKEGNINVAFKNYIDVSSKNKQGQRVSSKDRKQYKAGTRGTKVLTRRTRKSGRV